MAYTEHIAGALTDGVQHCVKCGMVLSDYRNVMVLAGSGPLRGWAEGKPVYVRGNYWSAQAPMNVTINECKG